MRREIKILCLACCATLLYGREEITREFQKTAALAGGRTLHMEHSQGNIVIRTHGESNVEIHASIKCSADNAADARSWCDQIKITVDENSAGVYVRTEYPHGNFFDHFRNFGYSVNYDVAMPKTAPLEIRNGFGAVTVSDLSADANIHNANGRVSFSNGRGRQRIENSFGDVEVPANDGDLTVVNTNGRVTANNISGALDVRNHFGDIQANHIGKRVDINAGNSNVTLTGARGQVSIIDTFGAVTAREIGGDLTVQNQNGRVEAVDVNGVADLRTSFEAVHFSRVAKGVTVRAQNSNVTGDTVGTSATVDTTFGSIDLRGVKGSARATAGNSPIRLTDIDGEVYAKTSFDGVTVENAAGPITVESTNASVTVRPRNSPKCQPVSLTTSYAPIRLTVPRGLGYDVTARTSFGRINSAAPMTMTGQISQDSVAGKIGGGGCQIRLIDQSGSIDIVN